MCRAQKKKSMSTDFRLRRRKISHFKGSNTPRSCGYCRKIKILNTYSESKVENELKASLRADTLMFIHGIAYKYGGRELTENLLFFDVPNHIDDHPVLPIDYHEDFLEKLEDLLEKLKANVMSGFTSMFLEKDFDASDFRMHSNCVDRFSNVFIKANTQTMNDYPEFEVNKNVHKFKWFKDTMGVVDKMVRFVKSYIFSGEYQKDLELSHSKFSNNTDDEEEGEEEEGRLQSTEEYEIKKIGELKRKDEARKNKDNNNKKLVAATIIDKLFNNIHGFDWFLTNDCVVPAPYPINNVKVYDKDVVRIDKLKTDMFFKKSFYKTKSFDKIGKASIMNYIKQDKEFWAKVEKKLENTYHRDKVCVIYTPNYKAVEVLRDDTEYKKSPDASGGIVKVTGKFYYPNDNKLVALVWSKSRIGEVGGNLLYAKPNSVMEHVKNVNLKHLEDKRLTIFYKLMT